jgi:glutamate-1-semialdehyde 2,1-aminomutase
MNLQDRANEVIAQGALTNSKRPETFVEGVYPTHLRNGLGCHVWDYQGKKYHDFITGLGSNLLGYAQEDINQAIRDRLLAGVTLSLGTEEELIVAEKIRQIIPFAESMKFLKSGSEACTAAVRIARAYTGRDFVYSDGYHGWHDEFVSLTEPATGVHGYFPIDELKYINDHGHSDGDGHAFLGPYCDIAAIIVEPIVTDLSQDRIKYLKDLRRFCNTHGIVLIFDEVITGFRFPRFCVSNYLEIEPDIIILGKAIANGLPLSVVAGKKEIMNCGEYFVSSTFAGETLSLVAASRTIDLLKTKYKLTDLWQKGEDWLKEFNSYWPEKIRIEGYATRGRFVGDPLIKALFFQEAVISGLLFGPSWFFNFPLSDSSKVTIDSAKDVICKIKSKNVKLMGKLPKSPFAEKVRLQIVKN